MKFKKLHTGQHMLAMTSLNRVWMSEHLERPKPTQSARHWYSASYVLPLNIASILAIVINSEVAYSLEEHGRRSSGVLSCGGSWKVHRRMIAGECVALYLEVTNTMVKKVRKKAIKVAVVVEVL